VSDYTIYLCCFYKRSILDSLAILKTKMVVELTYLILIAISFYLLRKEGIILFIVIILIGEIIRSLVYLSISRKALSIRAEEIFKIFIKTIKHTTFVVLNIWIITYFLESLNINNYVVLAFQIAAGLVALFVSYILFKDELNKEIKEIYFKITDSLNKANPFYAFIDKLILRTI
jgi:hypothetical protein